MLSIGRTPGQYVMIGNDIKVKLIQTSSGTLRFAIEAPEDFPVIRGELFEAQKKRQRQLKKQQSKMQNAAAEESCNRIEDTSN